MIVLMMEPVRTSETSVHFNVTTRRYIPEDSKLHIRLRENLKSHTGLKEFGIYAIQLRYNFLRVYIDSASYNLFCGDAEIPLHPSTIQRDRRQSGLSVKLVSESICEAWNLWIFISMIHKPFHR
jgi:hypothetical protein